ncbi:hypothetical protein E2C01_011698 [Portunus trituberculatus]|uniref:Uncharacterized protein n=1 Tax=Portunus trituberculatus TaxID=210409 RepID=A0A5B7DCM7_PORTR|nr:hypothetical protein [Portunus trituberculatus]
MANGTMVSHSSSLQVGADLLETGSGQSTSSACKEVVPTSCHPVHKVIKILRCGRVIGTSFITSEKNFVRSFWSKSLVSSMSACQSVMMCCEVRAMCSVEADGSNSSSIFPRKGAFLLLRLSSPLNTSSAVLPSTAPPVSDRSGITRLSRFSSPGSRRRRFLTRRGSFSSTYKIKRHYMHLHRIARKT